MTNRETSALKLLSKSPIFLLRTSRDECSEYILDKTRASFRVDFTSPIPESCAIIPFWHKPESFWMQGERDLSKFFNCENWSNWVGIGPNQYDIAR
jgi:hypothetical protein